MIRPWDAPADLPDWDRQPDEHVSFLFEARQVGGHVHVKVRAAHRHPSVQVNHSRGLCGELTFAPEEWALLSQVLADAEPPEPAYFETDHKGAERVVKLAGAGGAWGELDHEVDWHDHHFIEVMEAVEE